MTLAGVGGGLGDFPSLCSSSDLCTCHSPVKGLYDRDTSTTASAQGEGL